MKHLLSNLFFAVIMLCYFQTSTAQNKKANPQELIGTWKLDMSPQDKTDNNFAMMHIEKIEGNSMKGTFYREGVALRNGLINTQRGIVYGALISGDNSGEYNTSFYLKDGILYGSTHAVSRGFLSVWTATKK